MLILLIHNNKVGHRINKWVAESTKWVTESTKWVTESTNGVITESTKWVWVWVWVWGPELLLTKIRYEEFVIDLI